MVNSAASTAFDKLCSTFLVRLLGVTEENLSKLCQHAQITQADKLVMQNMQYLGVPIIQDVCSIHFFVFLEFAPKIS